MCYPIWLERWNSNGSDRQSVGASEKPLRRYKLPIMIRLESVVVASRDQVACEVSGELVILDMKTSQYFGLNPVGLRIWNLIQEPRTVAEVRDGILAAYPDVDVQRCTTDVVELLEQLTAADLAEVVPMDPEGAAVPTAERSDGS
jgi:hypothetical protein